MKKARVLALIITCILAVLSFTVSGCISSVVSGFNGSWKLDFEKCGNKVSEIIADSTLTVNEKEQRIYFTVELKSEDIRLSIEDGWYGLKYIYYGSFDDSGAVRYISAELDNDTSGDRFTYSHNENTIEVYVKCYFIEDGRKRDENVTLYFSRTDDIKNLPADSGTQKPNEKPDDKPAISSNFEKIKTAYKNAGYSVDLSGSDVDASMKALIDQMNAIYSQLGYSMTYIGKNLNNALSTEFYMLISTDTAEHTDEIADMYEGTYKYAKSGRDIIVSIWLLGTPNFTPFSQATK